jgi:hypothetical protein
LAIAIFAAGRAHADVPTIDEVAARVRALRTAVENPDSEPEPPDAKATLDLLALPLWFDGLGYADNDTKTLQACRKAWGAKGTVQETERLTQFINCAAIATWTESIDGDGEFKPINLARLPSVFKKHKTKLAKLAKDHALLFTHFCPAAPGDFWTLYGATKRDGQVRIDTLLVANEDSGRCRSEPK